MEVGFVEVGGGEVEGGGGCVWRNVEDWWMEV